MRQSVHYAWVDSLWDAVYQQRANSNFIGALLHPRVYSVKWAKHASDIGVPIWVSWHHSPEDYKGLNGSTILAPWRPTIEQLHTARTAPPPTPSFAEHADNPPAQTNPTNTPPPATSPVPALPPGSKFILSWEDFFRDRDEADKKAEAAATPTEKQQWENRRRGAQKYRMPGLRGPRVYTWREGDSGGFVRELVDRGDVETVWDDYRRREMVFNARANVWDLCPMLSTIVGENDQELDELDDAEDALGESLDRWMLEPQIQAQAPGEDTTDLGFLYRRYGFLSIEPTTMPDHILQLKKQAARRITGLKADGTDDGLQYTNHFITSILQGQLPDGHCDLTPTSPDNERFSSSSWGVIDRVSRVIVPDLGGALFACTPRDNRNKILIHDPLTVIEMARQKVQTYRTSIVDYLLRNGSQFTILSEVIEDPDLRNIHIITFPVRPGDWVADVGDYRIYMSRLKTFLTQRPHVATAALARGGIAWRLTREVLGTDIDLVLNGPIFRGLAQAVDVADFPQWFHDVDEGEWFFLVGGYDILTGSLALCHSDFH